MKKVYFILLHYFLLLSLQAQNFEWAKKEGLWAYDYGYGIANDNAGNIYVGGKYELEANFSGTILPDMGNHDIFLAKYDSTGNMIWVRTAGGPSGDYATAVACDGSNYVYITGEIEGDYLDVYFIGSSATITSVGLNDIFLAKYDLNGNLVWARQAGWWLDEKANGITYDASGNVYICGYFNDTTYFGTTQVLGYGKNDIFIAKYNANGVFQWVRKAGGKGRDEAKSIKCDAAGNVYVCGMFKDTITFGSQILIAPNGYFDMFLAKYSPAGTLLWVKSYGDNYDDLAWAITIDSTGFIYMTGEFNDYVYFDTIPLETTGESDVFVACINSAGAVQWVTKAGSVWVDRARGIGTDNQNVFITGQFSLTAQFGNTSITSVDTSDIFISALSRSGYFLWTLKVEGLVDSTETIGYESGNAVCATDKGNLYATGGLLTGGTFGNYSLSSYGRTDVFITRINHQCNNAPSPPAVINGSTGVCENATYTYDINPVSGATSYSWWLPAGWSGFSFTNSIMVTTNSNGGTISVIANNDCGSSSTVNLTVNSYQPPSSAGAGPDQTICASTTILEGITPIVGTGQWSVISGSVTINDPTSPTSMVTGIGYGVNVLRWTVSNGGCASTNDVKITRTPDPTPANAGPDQNVCTSTTTLAANTPMNGTGQWSVISGIATIANPAASNSAVSGLGLGSNILRWTISGPGCTPSMDDVEIIRSPGVTTANAGPDQNICAISTALAANTPVVGNGNWIVIAGLASIANPSSPTTTITNIGLGSNILRWTISSSGCPSSTDYVTIIRSQSPTAAQAGADQGICSTTSVLNANTPAIGSGVWSLISGNLSIQDSTSPTSAIYGMAVGQHILRWTISNGSCVASTDDVTIIRSQNISTAGAGPDQNICNSYTTLAAVTPLIGTGLWSVIYGTAIMVNPSSPTTVITEIGMGYNVMQWTISGNGCTSSSNDVVIRRYQKPEVSILTAYDSICKNDEILLIASGASTYEWMPGGMINDTITVSPDTTTIYIVRGTSANGCSDEDSITIIVIPCTKTAEIYDNNEFSIFPNPVKKECRISGIGFPAEVVIYNAAGLLVAILEATNETLVLNIPSGIYFMEITSQNKIIRKKFIVQK